MTWGNNEMTVYDPQTQETLPNNVSKTTRKDFGVVDMKILKKLQPAECRPRLLLKAFRDMEELFFWQT